MGEHLVSPEETGQGISFDQVALAGLAEAHPHAPSHTGEIVERIESVDQLPPDERHVAMTEIKLERHINAHGRPATSEGANIDDAIIDMAQRGKLATVQDLLTVAISEEQRLMGALQRRNPGVHAWSDPTWLALEKTLEEKGEHFMTAMQDKLSHLGEDAAQNLAIELRISNADPESALNVPDTFWRTLGRYPEEAREAFINSQQPLDKAAQALEVLTANGLLDHAKQLIDVIAAQDPARQQAVVVAMTHVLQQVPELSQSSLAVLATAQDPEHAFAVAQQASGAAVSPDAAVRNLRHIFAAQPSEIEPPYELTPATDTMLRLLGEVRQHAVSEHQTLQFVRNAMEGEVSPEDIATLRQFVDTLADWRTTVDAMESMNRPEATLDALGSETREIFATYETEGMGAIRTLTHKIGTLNQFNNLMLLRVAHEQPGSKIPEDDIIADPNTDGNMSHVTALLRSMGLPSKFQNSLFRSWMAFDEIRAAQHRYGNLHNMDDGNLQLILNTGIDNLYQNIHRTQEYMRTYGKDELVELYDTFRIVNLGRAAPETFHNQLQRWHNPEEVVKNIELATASGDWNGAFATEVEKLHKLFGEEGSFYFEADSTKQLGEALVHVGDRERAAGRDPQTQPTLENLIIGGHGSPESITLSYGNYINVAAYARAITGQEALNATGDKPIAQFNDYQRHLGNKFRVILQACSANGETMYGLNISQYIKQSHRVEDLQASPVKTTGFTITPDNKVEFAEYKPEDRQG